MTNKLNTEELKKLSKFLHLNDTLRILLSKHKEEDKNVIIDHLNSHLTFVRGTLIDLGVEFKEIEKIKNLNLRIREMESSFSNPLFNDSTVSSYISTESKKFKDFFQRYGLKGSFSYSFNPNISASFSLFETIDTDDNFNTLLNNFELFNRENDPGYEVAYSEKNILILENLIYSFFGNSADFNYNVKSYKSTNNKYIAGISGVNIYVPTNNSSKSISESLIR